MVAGGAGDTHVKVGTKINDKLARLQKRAAPLAGSPKPGLHAGFFFPGTKRSLIGFDWRHRGSRPPVPALAA
jgi:hypothetical protein